MTSPPAAANSNDVQVHNNVANDNTRTISDCQSGPPSLRPSINGARLNHKSDELTTAAASPADESLRSSAALLSPSYARPRPDRNHRQLSISPSPHTSRVLLDEEEDGASPASSTEKSPANEASEKVTWSSLPRKGQLAILTLARLSEPLTQTSLQSYLYYQLQSFDKSHTPAQITTQAGIVTAAFAAAQALTSVIWGRVADARWGGRKIVIVVGLLGTGLGSLGYGFSTNWYTAVMWRVIAGILNGNVGVMRTMISEIVKERKYLSRAFLLLPMCFNIGVIIGPVMGGLMADPVGSYPSIFGPGSYLGGKDGIWWMEAFPYALPNIVSSVYLISAAVMVFFGLEETHWVLKDRPDIGVRMGKAMKRALLRAFGRHTHDYAALPSQFGTDDPFPGDIESSSTPVTPATPLTPTLGNKAPPIRRKLPFRRLWTRNVVITLISHFLLAMSVGTFNALWFLFLSAPRFDPAHPIPSDLVHQEFPFRFTGGLGLPPPKIGLAMAILGFLGISLQIFLYPRVSGRWGTLRSFQYSVLLFPLVYLLTPYLALVPSSSEAPQPAGGVLVWIAIACVLAGQVLGRTFALPATGILINNASPHPSILGTMHGIAQSVSSVARSVGPMMAGWMFGMGLNMGMVGLVFWVMAAMSIIETVVSRFLCEGDGHEIWLEGEAEEMEQTQREAAAR